MGVNYDQAYGQPCGVDPEAADMVPDAPADPDLKCNISAVHNHEAPRDQELRMMREYLQDCEESDAVDVARLATRDIPLFTHVDIINKLLRALTIQIDSAKFAILAFKGVDLLSKYPNTDGRFERQLAELHSAAGALMALIQSRYGAVFIPPLLEAIIIQEQIRIKRGEAEAKSE